DAGAPKEPRRTHRRLRAARRSRPRARCRRRVRLGDPAGARAARDHPARLHAAEGACGALPRGVGRRLPVPLRGLRDADRRGDGMRRSGRRVVPCLARRGVGRGGVARGPARPGRPRRRDPARARRPGTARRARPRARLPVHVGGERARASRSVVAMKIALDVSPLRLTQAGTARYIDNLGERLDGVRQIACGGRARGGVLGSELWWYPFRLASIDADVLHCTTYYGPLAPRTPTVMTVHDLAVWRHPEAFGRWTRTYVPRVVP